jgi:predicted DNA-binding transcriptional regulator AlpA
MPLKRKRHDRQRGKWPAAPRSNQAKFERKENSMYKSYDDLPSVLSVKELKDFLGISRAGAYQLLHREDFPTLHIASRMLVAKDKLLAWMEQNTDTVNGVQ